MLSASGRFLQFPAYGYRKRRYAHQLQVVDHDKPDAAGSRAIRRARERTSVGVRPEEHRYRYYVFRAKYPWCRKCAPVFIIELPGTDFSLVNARQRPRERIIICSDGISSEKISTGYPATSPRFRRGSSQMSFYPSRTRGDDDQIRRLQASGFFVGSS